MILKVVQNICNGGVVEFNKYLTNLCFFGIKVSHLLVVVILIITVTLYELMVTFSLLWILNAVFSIFNQKQFKLNK